ncbi:MAG: anti-sigma factor antagonist [Verrucomicrobiales bacterium]|nr:anti-sigma factor antagonist [Verrucomicrobiales bacterium]
MIDIPSLEIVIFFLGQVLGNISSMAGILRTESMVVGMQPAAAITPVEPGLSLTGVHTALDVEKGMEILWRFMASDTHWNSPDANPVEI